MLSTCRDSQGSLTAHLALNKVLLITLCLGLSTTSGRFRQTFRESWLTEKSSGVPCTCHFETV